MFREVTILLVALFVPGRILAADLSPEEILRLADRPKSAYAEAVLHVKATVYENARAREAAEFELYKKGDDSGLIIFTAGKQRGRKILTVGEKFWLIVPGSSRAIPVTANQRLIGGASMGDVARLRFSREFAARMTGRVETIDGRQCDAIELSARSVNAPYGGGTVWVDRVEHLARRAVLNLISGKPSREVTFDRYSEENGSVVLSAMTVRDLISGGLETRLEYSNYRKAKLPDSLFTPEGALNFQ